MSRIGYKSIDIPDKVMVNVGAAGELAVEGPKGKLHFTLPRTRSSSSPVIAKCARPRLCMASRAVWQRT
jgi:ribosomal protein L6P/L9E